MTEAATMTNRQLAIEALGRHPASDTADPGCDPFVDAVERAIAEAVAAERERCAKIVKEFVGYIPQSHEVYLRERIADDIRKGDA